MNRRGFIASMAGASVVKPAAEAAGQHPVRARGSLRRIAEESMPQFIRDDYQGLDPRHLAAIYRIPVHVMWGDSRIQGLIRAIDENQRKLYRCRLP